jgi:hypothetical protein
MLNRTPDAVRNVVFELCGSVPMFQPAVNLPSCGWFLAKYNSTYWGGTPFTTLEMMRDADDVGQPSGNPSMPRINFKKEGLFDATKPLFPDMIAGNYEEWTVSNRTFSDHPFHLHQNHVLITKINGITLPLPEWHDTLVVPTAMCPPDNATCLGPCQAEPPPGIPCTPNINLATPGSITFRTYFNPVTVGCFVAHCHTLDHEDLGMMQRMDILAARGAPSRCPVSLAASNPDSRQQLAGSFAICSSSAPRAAASIASNPALRFSSRKQ